MNMIQKLFTALRGGAHEVGEAIVDKNALIILDQEIRDAGAEHAKATEALKTVLAQQAIHEKKIEGLNNDIESFTQKALKADEMGKQELALEIATAVGQKTQERDAEQKLLNQFKDFAAKQRETVLKMDRTIKNARSQAEITKARASIQSAQKSVSAATSSSTSGLNNAMESLNRLREKQDMTDEVLKAGEALDAETSGASLEARMKEAGIEEDKYGGANILAGLKKNTTQA
jgi:phage shock protein A